MGDPSGNCKSGNSQIPAINKESPLIKRLIMPALVGFDEVLGNNGKLYLRLLVRLVDKSVSEYNIAKEYLDQEIKNGNKLDYGFIIINHLENCINAINRVAKTFQSSMKVSNKIKDNDKLSKYLSKESIENIEKFNTASIRNKVEHIDDDIQKGEFRGQLFLAVDNNYEKICISNKSISLSDLVLIIESYRKAVLEIFDNLPNRLENGKYYHNDTLIQ